ncbi:MAG: zf-HC2 domain-containing protein [Dyella sp.]
MTFPMNTGRDCAIAWEAMPWVLQGSAPQEQSQWLSEHLAQCESCRAEFAQQQQLQLAMSLPADITLDADVGLRRLLGRLDMPELPEIATPKRSSASPWLQRALIAAVLVQAIGIGVLGAKLGSAGGSAPAPYRTLSQQAAPVAPGAIHVVPDASMKLADWDTLLHQLRLQVVQGPNDVGAYTVVPTGAASASTQILAQLRATHGIRLAEPVAATP